MRNIFPFILTLFICSCESMIVVDLPKNQIAYERVFANDANATSAISGMYQDMISADNFASGYTSSVTVLAGLSSDEIRSYYDYYPEFTEFEDNLLSPENSYVALLWTTAYKIIYESNDIIEGLNRSSEVTDVTRQQILGEAYFIRAFTHFYLTNLFKDVPVVLTTDYRINSKVRKSNQSDVYAQVITDLLTAKELLTESYVTTERVRPNKSTARALLSRIYLYQERWSDAEQEASDVIAQSQLYHLTELNAVFLKNSMESIWQLMQSNTVSNTWEGNLFITPADPEIFVLRDELVSAFELDDQRAFEWMDSIPSASEWLYYPTKYKIKTGADLSEYSMVFRLGEQFLIRAEARAQQDELDAAIIDLDSIRSRAGLDLIQQMNPSITKEDFLQLLQHERRVELFTEWGHRWFDLKRKNSVDDVLLPIKQYWVSTAAYYPLPQKELNTNKALGNQNDGY